jgi:endonuclease V-like protein UPF0215 family
VPARSKKNIDNREGLPVIKCCCGVEILFVPNVKSMSEAIEAHVEKHRKKVKELNEADAEAERIREYLIMQVLDKASKTDE